ncbi:MAG: NAD(P)H-dependent oxidoreductase [Pyrinomonadaceae bacterium]|nr:NAD(P)H-dependent oxidoreductase [Pyrinomonadaceae bacterium]
MSDNGIKSENILEKLNWRYATKSYDPAKKISDSDWATLEESLVLAPSSFGLQPYKYIVVTDPETREKLKPAAWGQPQITDASHLVVFAYKKTLTDADIEHYVDRIVEVRGGSREDLADYENVMKSSAQKAVDGGYIEVWNSRQAYIALGFLLQTAALLGIDATPMEGFDPAQFNEILGLTDYSAVAVAALGYRNAEGDWLANLPKVRFPKEELIVRV